MSPFVSSYTKETVNESDLNVKDESIQALENKGVSKGIGKP